jgi:hypothetical protein
MVFNKGRRVWTGFFRARYVSAFTELLPVFRVFHLGPTTAWQANFAGSSTRAREKIDVLIRRRDLPQGADLLLVFGEIDIRCHMPKAVMASKSVNDVVSNTIERFLSLPLRLRSLGFTPSVWLPTVMPDTPETADPAKHPLPVIGPQSLRDEIQTEYCKQLANTCAVHSILCTGIAESENALGADRFLDGHHLSQRLMPAAIAALMESGILSL